MRSIYIVMAVGYAAGIFITSIIGVDYLVLFSVIFVLCLCIKGVFQRRFCTVQLLWIILLTAGAVHFTAVTDSAFTDSYEFTDKYVTVKGRVSELPLTYNDTYYYYVVDLKEMTYKGKTFENHDKIKLSTKTRYQYGDTVAAEGFLEEIPDKMNHTSFDTKLYNKSKGIFFSLTALKDRPWGTKYIPLTMSNLINTGKNKLSQFIDRYYVGDGNAYLKAIFLGDKTGFDEEYGQTLQESGAKRFLYTPFLHILLLTAVCGWIFTTLSFDKRRRDFWMICLLLVYVFLNSTSPVLMKMPLMMLLLLYRKRRRGYVYYPEIPAIAVFLILWIEPLYLFNTGFIFSVACTVLLYLFYRPVSDKLSFIPRPGIRRLIAVWLICTIGLFPLSAYFFGGASSYTILCTLLFAPLVIIVTIISIPVFLLLAICKTAPAIGTIQAFCLWIMAKLPIFIEQIPFCYVHAKPPSPVELLCFYLFAGIIRYRLLDRGKLFPVQLLRTAAYTLLIIAVVEKFALIGTMDLTFVNVGQGDAAIIQIPYRDTILIDGGGGAPYSDYSVGQKIYMPYLQKEGIFYVDTAIVSHYHKDHCEGIAEALKQLRIKLLVMPDCDEENEYRRLLEDTARQNGTEILYIREDTTITYRSGLTIHILYPDKTALQSDDLNDTSIVCSVEYGDFRALFTGDITENAEKKLQGKLGRYSLVKTAHHGSAQSSSNVFLTETQPQYAVISVGQDNAYGLPAREVIQRYEQIGADILRTDLLGDIRFQIKARGGIQKIKTWR